MALDRFVLRYCGNNGVDFETTLRSRDGNHPGSVRSFGGLNEMNGIESIAAERLRQINKEGFNADHDAQHEGNELALAAAAYAVYPITLFRVRHGRYDGTTIEDCWPDYWDSGWDGRDDFDRRKRLVVAGALIAAEIDRLDREAEG